MRVWAVVDPVVVIIDVEGVAVHVGIVVIGQGACIVLVGVPVGLEAAASVLEHIGPHVVIIVGIGVVARAVVVVVVLLRWVVWEDVL